MYKSEKYTFRHKFVATILLFGFLLQGCTNTLGVLEMNNGNEGSDSQNKKSAGITDPLLKNITLESVQPLGSQPKINIQPEYQNKSFFKKYCCFFKTSQSSNPLLQENEKSIESGFRVNCNIFTAYTQTNPK